MADRRELLLDLFARDRASQTFKRVGAAAEDTGDSFQEAARDANRLEQEIEEADKALRDLAQQFARTDDAARRMDLTKAMRRQQAEIRKLTKTRDLLPDPGQMAAEMGVSVGARFGPVFISTLRTSLAGAGTALGPVLAGVAIAAAVPLGAAIAGAVIGGVGVGGVIGGVAAAARDPQVKAAAARLGETLLGELDDAAEVMVPAVLKSFSMIQREVRGLSGDLRAVFGAGAGYLPQLTAGLAVGIRSLVGGFRDVMVAAGPVIDTISEGFANLGDAVGDVFRDLSDNGADAAVALQLAFAAVESTIRGVGAVVNALTEAFGFLAKSGALGAELQLEWLRLETNAKLAAAAQQEAAASIKTAGSAAANAAIAHQGMAAAIAASTSRALAASNSQIALEQAIDDAAEAVKGGSGALDINTEKGRANRIALNNLAAAANQAAEDILAETGSQEDATAAAERGRKKFMELATKMGMSAKEAKELAGKLFAIPNIKRDVTVNNKQAMREAQEIKNMLAGIRSKTVHIYTRAHLESIPNISQGMLMREKGGPVRKGEAYIVGEKRPEVFVPDRDGKIIPSIDQYQKTTTSGGGRRSGTQTLRLEVAGEREIVALFRRLIRTANLLEA